MTDNNYGKIEKAVGDTVAIDRKRLEELEEDSRFLSALRAAGVDNWQGIDVVSEMLEEMYPSEYKR